MMSRTIFPVRSNVDIRTDGTPSGPQLALPLMSDFSLCGCGERAETAGMSDPQPYADLIEALKARGPTPDVTNSVSAQAARVIEELLSRVPQANRCVVRKAAALEAAEAC